MNRVEFGRLIASLRREHEDENDRPWNQERLAREANAVVGAEVLSKYIVSNIERGNRILDEETLLALAAALRLTSGERKEFFLAASGVDNERIALQRDEPEEVKRYTRMPGLGWKSPVRTPMTVIVTVW